MAYPKINIDQIIAEFGAQYRQGGIGQQNLQTAIFQPEETRSLFTPWPTEDTIVYKATASIKRVLQAFQKSFTPIGDVKFELESIALDRVKIDEYIEPDDIMPTFLGFLAGMGPVDRTQWGIVRYMIEELIVKQYKQDLEISEIFKGVKGPIIEGTPNLEGTSINGVRKKLRDGHTAGKTNMITMGTPPVDPVEFVEYVEDFIKQIPELYRFRMDGLTMNKTLRARFKEGMRLKYNVNYAQVSSLLTVLDAENIAINGVASMAGSNMMYATFKANTAAPEKWGANQQTFDMQKFDRGVKLLSDWWVGIGFWYLGWVWHNDQDLV
ncbi:hypothetical protein KHS38_11855 [Mucilaginibacter sp. Bleaf8]|uniref:hypothetical protein n=1 Tax=Mucilaginibacter sp. Bleaf8 TaxID=2834430 RepID=UPI001BD19D84|nr:hypothetical protein [Mucilaginibacter sp. Bleaf8]MBS7565100.1 hypothetical protein [Mucilaginibacter sp. Bleaf8]